MNKSTIINIVLGVAVIGLYVLHFTNNKDVATIINPDTKKDTTEISVSPKEFPQGSIVFVKIDSVLQNYDYYHQLFDDLKNDQEKLQNRLDSRAAEFQRRQAEFQQKVQKGLLLRSEQQEIYQELMKEQQSLMQENEQSRVSLMEKEQVAMRRILNKVEEFMKNNYSDKASYVLGKSAGGGILYSDSSLDVTQEVINGLNKEYKDELNAKNE